MQKRERNGRDADACILRLIAAFFVVLIHASGSADLYHLTLNGIARFSVPVFVILSGRYLLAKQRSWGDILKKCLRLFLLMLLWSAVYYLQAWAEGGRPDTPLFAWLLTEPVHLWYLWAMILLYLLTPMLGVFCEHAERSTYLAALGFTFATGTILTCLLRAEISPVLAAVADRAKLPVPLGFVFCYLLGDYSRRYGLPGSKWLGLAGFFVCTAATMLGLRLNGSAVFLSFFSPFSVLAAVGLCQFMSGCRWNGCSRLLQTASGCTLGIYLMHPLWVKPVGDLLFSMGISGRIHPLLCTVLVFGLSLLLTAVMRKIPLLKKAG